MQVEKELQDLRERLEKVDEWKERREEIEQELAAVWTEKGEALAPPSYVAAETEGEGEGQGQAELEQSGEMIEASS